MKLEHLPANDALRECATDGEIPYSFEEVVNMFNQSQAENARLREALLDAANECDKWAHESVESSWSTHQVNANRDLANRLRRSALGKE